jgi:hypothetical protein
MKVRIRAITRRSRAVDATMTGASAQRRGFAKCDQVASSIPNARRTQSRFQAPRRGREAHGRPNC